MHCLFIFYFLPIRLSSVLTENSFGMVEDQCVTSPSVITEDLNNSAYALREVCPDATCKQIEQALSHNHHSCCSGVVRHPRHDTG